jgi:hypothetical protein
MANTIDSNLQLDVLSQAVLQAFTDAMIPINAFSTDFGGEISQAGATVSVPVFNNKSAKAFAGNYKATPDSTTGAVKVTVDQHNFVNAHVTDTQLMNYPTHKLEEIGYQAGEALAKDVIDTIFGIVLEADYTNEHEIALADFDSDEVINIKAKADALKMPRVRRSLILNDSFYNALLKDPDLKNATNYGSPEGVQAGLIPNLVGFKTYQLAIPDNSEDLAGVAVVPSAIAVAMRYLKPSMPQAYEVARSLVHAPTGITLGVRNWYEPSEGAQYLVYEANYGVSKALVGGLVRIVDTTSES